MRIYQIIWLQKFVEKLQIKHDVMIEEVEVMIEEVEEVLYGKMKVRRVAKGDVDGEDVYMALGQTYAGRYLAIFFILKRNQAALPISARHEIWMVKREDNMDADNRDAIPEHFDSAEEAGEFWDTHSAADYWGEMEEVEIEFDLQEQIFLLPVAQQMYKKIKQKADTENSSIEELINRVLEREFA